MAARERFFKENAVIFFENDEPGNIYLISEGKVQLTRRGFETTQLAGPGDLIGVPSAVGQMNRLYTAKVLEEVTAYEIPPESFKSFVRSNIPGALKIIQKMCSELRELGVLISEPVKAGGEQELLGIAEYFYEKQMMPQALYAYETYLETYHGADNFEDVAFKLAGLYEKTGSGERARDLYVSLRDRFPEGSVKWEAYNKLARGIGQMSGLTDNQSGDALTEVFSSLVGTTETSSSSPPPKSEDKENIIGFLLEQQESDSK